MMKSELASSIKYGLSAGSKIFTGITVWNMLMNFISGGDAGVFSQETLDKLVLTFICIGSSLMFDKLKINKWVKYVISYVFVLAMVMIYVTLISYFIMEMTISQMWPNLYLGMLQGTTIIFLIVTAFEEMTDRYKSKKKVAEPKGDEAP